MIATVSKLVAVTSGLQTATEGMQVILQQINQTTVTVATAQTTFAEAVSTSLSGLKDASETSTKRLVGDVRYVLNAASRTESKLATMGSDLTELTRTVQELEREASASSSKSTPLRSSQPDSSLRAVPPTSSTKLTASDPSSSQKSSQGQTSQRAVPPTSSTKLTASDPSLSHAAPLRTYGAPSVARTLIPSQSNPEEAVVDRDPFAFADGGANGPQKVTITVSELSYML